jgi:hypothetical protein
MTKNTVEEQLGSGDFTPQLREPSGSMGSHAPGCTCSNHGATDAFFRAIAHGGTDIEAARALLAKMLGKDTPTTASRHHVEEAIGGAHANVSEEINPLTRFFLLLHEED